MLGHRTLSAPAFHWVLSAPAFHSFRVLLSAKGSRAKFQCTWNRKLYVWREISPRLPDGVFSVSHETCGEIRSEGLYWILWIASSRLKSNPGTKEVRVVVELDSRGLLLQLNRISDDWKYLPFFARFLELFLFLELNIYLDSCLAVYSEYWGLPRTPVSKCDLPDQFVKPGCRHKYKQRTRPN